MADKSQVIQTLGEGIQPVIHEGRIKWKRVPREPIPELSDINTWVGKQLMHKNMSHKYQHMQPKGSLIATDSSFPEGLLAVPSPEGQPRIIVPPSEIKALILQTHEDIHHQNHVKVLHVLKCVPVQGTARAVPQYRWQYRTKVVYALRLSVMFPI